MSFLTSGEVKGSNMRKIVWVLTLVFIVWGTAEITTYIWMSALDKTFTVHTAFLLGGLGIIFGGKVTQKGVEVYKQTKSSLDGAKNGLKNEE